MTTRTTSPHGIDSIAELLATVANGWESIVAEDSGTDEQRAAATELARAARRLANALRTARAVGVL